jgi:hypothetical protein
MDQKKIEFAEYEKAVSAYNPLKDAYNTAVNTEKQR